MTTLTRPADDANGARPGERCSDGTCVQVDVYIGEHLAEPLVRVRSTATDTVMQARASEWRAFVAQVKNGEWDHVDTDVEFAAARRVADDFNAIVTAAVGKAR